MNRYLVFLLLLALSSCTTFHNYLVHRYCGGVATTPANTHKLKVEVMDVKGHPLQDVIVQYGMQRYSGKSNSHGLLHQTVWGEASSNTREKNSDIPGDYVYLLKKDYIPTRCHINTSQALMISKDMVNEPSIRAILSYSMLRSFSYYDNTTFDNCRKKGLGIGESFEQSLGRNKR